MPLEYPGVRTLADPDKGGEFNERLSCLGVDKTRMARELDREVETLVDPNEGGRSPLV